MSRRVVLITLLFVVGTASAQYSTGSIQWQTDPQRAVALAARLKRPLVVHVKASDRYTDDQLDREQKRSFRNPKIVERVHRSFVPLQLSRARHRTVLKEFGFSEHANLEMSFVTPEGKVLGNLSPAGIAKDESLYQKLGLILKQYATQVYREEVKPVFDNKDANPTELKKALDTVNQLEMEAAEKDVLDLLDRPRLPNNVRRAAYQALAVLSTKGAVDKLLELAGENDPLAAKALAECQASAVDFLLPELKTDDESVNYVAYQALVKICRISKPKPERFFERAKDYLVKQEIERVTEQARQYLSQWRAQNG